MFEFEKVCREVEKMDPDTYFGSVALLSARVIEGVSAITENGLTGLTVFRGLVLGSIVADGKLSEAEFVLVEPALSEAVGEPVSYDEAKGLLKYFKEESKEQKQFVDAVTDLFGEISDDLKTDIVMLCMLICGVDGKISLREKMWLKKLIK